MKLQCFVGRISQIDNNRTFDIFKNDFALVFKFDSSSVYLRIY